MTTPLRVCVLEDPRVDNNHLGRRLRQAGLQVDMLAQQPAPFLAALARKLPPVALVDVSHPQGDRLEVLETLARTYPAMRVVAAVPRAESPLGWKCRASGAWTCVSKPRSGAARLARDLTAVHRAPSRATSAGLTPRELEVLRHVSTGSDNLQISALLDITERTVKSHVGHLYRKLGAHSRVELALAGRALG